MKSNKLGNLAKHIGMLRRYFKGWKARKMALFTWVAMDTLATSLPVWNNR